MLSGDCMYKFGQMTNKEAAAILRNIMRGLAPLVRGNGKPTMLFMQLEAFSKAIQALENSPWKY